MKILVISDIHENIGFAQEILDTPREWDKVVFLGDYFDSFYNDPFNSILQWIEKTYNDYKDSAIWLVGNHEIHYIVEAYSKLKYTRKMRDLPLGCSGYSRCKAHKIKKSDFLKDVFFPNLKFCHYENNVLFSHAGFSFKHFAPRKGFHTNITEWQIKWKEFFSFLEANDYYSALNGNIWVVGRERGYSNTIGSPLWMDYNEFCDFPLQNKSQVFGHTHGKVPRTLKNGFYSNVCLDTGLAYYAIIDDKEIRIYDSFDHKIYRIEEIKE